MSTDFDKMAFPSAAMLDREITLEVFKANTWRLMAENQAEVFGKIDTLLSTAPRSPMITLLVVHCIIDGLRRTNLKLPNYALLEEAMAEVAQQIGDTVSLMSSS